MPVLHLQADFSSGSSVTLTIDAQVPPQMMELTQYVIRNKSGNPYNAKGLYLNLPFISAMDVRSTSSRHGLIPITMKKLPDGDAQFVDCSMRFQISKAVNNQFTIQLLEDNGTTIAGTSLGIVIDLYFTYNRYNIF
tara:strand:- start:7352 stop:7759 length:408 start_codon:yes stop_codon:yes gene_type:complete